MFSRKGSLGHQEITALNLVLRGVLVLPISIIDLSRRESLGRRDHAFRYLVSSEALGQLSKSLRPKFLWSRQNFARSEAGTPGGPQKMFPHCSRRWSRQLPCTFGGRVRRGLNCCSYRHRLIAETSLSFGNFRRVRNARRQFGCAIIPTRFSGIRAEPNKLVKAFNFVFDNFVCEDYRFPQVELSFEMFPFD